jgi:hypothetical protein
MFNYGAIDKTPTVMQVRAIIDYMEKDPDVKYNFANMMKMSRPELNKILLDLNNAHLGTIYQIDFKDGEIIAFDKMSIWIS